MFQKLHLLMVTFPPGLMIPGTVTRNPSLKFPTARGKNEVAYPYIFILLRFSNFIDGEIDSLYTVSTVTVSINVAPLLHLATGI